MDKSTILSYNSRISKMWDDNVLTRAKDLEEGTDYSYTKIILPFVKSAVLRHSEPESSILDIGCGCGYLTNAVYNLSRHNIEGIDLSPQSIQYSQNKYPYISFLHQDVYSMPMDRHFDLCLSVMTVNNLPDSKAFFEIAAQLTAPAGTLVVVVPHPCFWPYRHLSVGEFSYESMQPYEIPFSTKGRRDYNSPILYFHRPVENYLNFATAAGFKCVWCEELSETTTGLDTPDILGLVFKR